MLSFKQIIHTQMLNALSARGTVTLGWMTQGSRVGHQAGVGMGVGGSECQEHVAGKEAGAGGTGMVSPLHPTSAGPDVHLCGRVRTTQSEGSITDQTGKGPGIRIISKIVLRRAGWVLGDPIVNVEALNGQVGCFLYHFRGGRVLCHLKKEKALSSSIVNNGKFIFS